MKYHLQHRFRILWRKSLRLKLAACFLVLVFFLAVLAPVLPLPYAPNYLDLAQAYRSPGAGWAAKHWLGTDHLGRDVLANLVFGFRTAFMIGLPVMLVTTFAGTLAGSLAAYYGNRKLRLSRASVLGILLALFPLWFFGVYRRQVFLAEAAGTGAFLLEVLQSLGWVLLVIAGFLGLARLLKVLGFFRKKVPLPLDEMVLKLMEVLSSVPRLVLILTLAALVPAGVGNVVLLLCLTYWAGPARLVRAEVLKIKALPYVEAGRASGLTDHRLLFRHILPNAAAPLITAFVFGLGGLIGLEATLSFLGIGLPPETPSLGRMLAAYRGNLNAWWLAVFPAVLLYFIVLSLQIIGFFLQKTTGKDV